MGWTGLERNKLDYILTDLLPVELSELFSFKPFYDYLLEKTNNKILCQIVEDVKLSKAKNDKKIICRWLGYTTSQIFNSQRF